MSKQRNTKAANKAMVLQVMLGSASGETCRSSVADIVGCSPATAGRYIREMVADGKLQKVTGKAGAYQLTADAAWVQNDEWGRCGGMSQHSRATEPVHGRTGCTCPVRDGNRYRAAN